MALAGFDDLNSFDREELEQWYRNDGGEAVPFDELEEELERLEADRAQRGTTERSPSQQRGSQRSATPVHPTGGDAKQKLERQEEAASAQSAAVGLRVGVVPPEQRRPPRPERAAPPASDAGLRWKLDHITKSLVGCARPKRALSMLSKLGEWGAVLEYLCGMRQPPDRSEEERKKLNIRMPTVRETNAFIRLFARELIEDVRLLRRFKAGMRTLCRCGLFGVQKALYTLRVIFDARQANARIAPIPFAFVLFTVDELVRAWAATGRYGDIYTINVDYRHYYYQFQIPAWLVRYVAVRVDGEDYHPTVLPMGFRDACLYAQVFTWCIVLYREKGEDALGVPDEVVLGPQMPRYIPLQGGGAIFVLLDGIFIIDHDAERHKRWKARLKRNEEKFRIIRKVGRCMRFTRKGRELDKDDVPPADPTDPTRAAEEVSKATKEASTFAGVEFLSVLALAPAKALPLLVDVPSWRQLSSCLSSILWHLRIIGAGRPLCGNNFSLLHREPMLQLWSHIGREAASGWGNVAVWTDTQRQYLGLILEWLRDARHDMRAVACPPCSGCIENAGIFAVDATRKTMAYVAFRWRDDYLDYVTEGCESFDKEVEQSEGELRAALWAAEMQRQRPPCGRCQAPALVIVGGDADGARAALRKGYSRSERFRELMRPVFKTPDVRIEATRIPGVLNAADAPSRGRAAHLEPQCMWASQLLLEAEVRRLFSEAREFWG